MIEPEVEAENIRLQEILKRSIVEKRGVNEKEMYAFRRDDMNRMAENQVLLKEINALRGMVRQKPQGKDLPSIGRERGGVKSVEGSGSGGKKSVTSFPSIKA
jgi:hypothetical protein